ncbi:hypothetical protein [Pseudomonas fluorescens]|uniref:hypothetical protein n=1 Tax=Pseudomonas fluorescens TaxID=294 RepID=UPI001CD3C49A|nr:hypothetical protein [Pseudomonas fluorescens]
MASDYERSDQLGVMQIEASNKLDQFILGVTLAICAYLAQTNPYAPLGLNQETMLLFSLLIFASSAAFGFWRIEAKIAVMFANAQALDANNSEVIEAHRSMGLKFIRKSVLHYHCRNILLVAGLATYVGTKVWASYQSNGWIPLH